MAARSAARAPLESYVLHSYDWSESSLILDLFTRERGRLAVAAKGAKRPYSQLRSVLLPFQRIAVNVGRVAAGDEGREVENLRTAEWAGGAAMLTGAALFSGFYLNELLMKLLARQDPHPALFDAYAATLPMLAATEDHVAEIALRAFELVFLKEIGVLPDLSLETATLRPVDADRGYALLADAGVTPAITSGVQLEGRALVALQASLEHGDLRAIQAACSASLQELKVILRAQLQYQLGSTQLRTRQVMIDAQSLA